MKNFFTLFSLPIKFSINLDDLEKKYFFFQRQFHPDAAGVAEIENSMDVNEGYEILRNPLRRAAHILQLNNIDVEKDGGAIKPDMATLSEVLEIQESIFDLDIQGIVDLKKYLNNKINSSLEDIAAKLDNKEFMAAAQLLIKAKYFDKILRDLRK